MDLLVVQVLNVNGVTVEIFSMKIKLVSKYLVEFFKLFLLNDKSCTLPVIRQSLLLSMLLLVLVYKLDYFNFRIYLMSVSFDNFSETKMV